jgi:4'-phosphopantetheinyl transferase
MLKQNLNAAIVWSPRAEPLRLFENEIHVWHTSLKSPAELARRFESLLSPDEKHRAVQFYFSRDRELFGVTRGILRELIGAYLNRSAAELRFSCDPRGKPSIKQEEVNSPLRFNLSHTRGCALYAFVRGRQVGIDVERIIPDSVRETIAEHFFAPAELIELRALPKHLQVEAFFECWTRKEAYVKACGKGLQMALDSFEVTLTPRAPARFVRGVEPRWKLVAFTPEPNYVAALVFEGGPCHLRFFRFE